MDAAKIMWLLYEHPEIAFSDVREKFFDIRKRAFKIPPLGTKAKLVCIPTSSGTGSEVTPFAVITDHKTGYKYPITDYALTPVRRDRRPGARAHPAAPSWPPMPASMR
ncbi:MAG: iron-containing alcohol dehydrogenase [Bifidobacterium pullorum]